MVFLAEGTKLPSMENDIKYSMESGERFAGKVGNVEGVAEFRWLHEFPKLPFSFLSLISSISILFH